MDKIMLGDPPSASVARSIYLPIIATAPDPVGLSPSAAEFLRLLTGDDRQQRASLTVCASLLVAAEKRAYGLANGDPWGHTDRFGITPNEYARRAGCTLPDGYADKGNNIESLGAGTADAAVMFAALAGSPKHSDHLFGRGWFQHQTSVGIALAQGGEYGWYWVILIALCQGVT